jgi:hypothetical protein
LKRANLRRKWSTTISKTAENLSKAGWSWGCVSALDSRGRTIWIADAHRDNGKRFIVRADEKLRAFLELQRVTRESFRFPNAERLDTILAMQPFHGFTLATAPPTRSSSRLRA